MGKFSAIFVTSVREETGFGSSDQVEIPLRQGDSPAYPSDSESVPAECMSRLEFDMHCVLELQQQQTHTLNRIAHALELIAGEM